MLEFRLELFNVIATYCEVTLETIIYGNLDLQDIYYKIMDFHVIIDVLNNGVIRQCTTVISFDETQTAYIGTFIFYCWLFCLVSCYIVMCV